MDIHRDLEKAGLGDERVNSDNHSSIDLEDSSEKQLSSDPCPVQERVGAQAEGATDSEAPRSTSDKAASIKRTRTAQDWEGPDDPENPHNWPMWKRVWHTVPPAILSFSVTFGSSVYTPSYPEVAERFNVSRTAALLGLTLYVFGLAFGPMIAAPLSETFGRRVVYLASPPLSMLFNLGAGFSNSFGSLLACRFLAGTAGSPVLAVGAGTNADLFPPRLRAVATSCFLMAPFLGPAIGPVIGGFAAQYKGWRWTQWSLLFVSVATYIVSLPQKETYKKAILVRRAKRSGLALPPGLPSGWAGLKFLGTVTLLRPLHMLLTEPIVFFMSLYTAFNFSVLFLFFAAVPYTFRSVYHFETYQSGLIFLAVGFGVLLAVATAVIIDRTVYIKHHRRAEENLTMMAAPEHRLYSAMVGSVGVPVGLFWFAWTAKREVHWIVPTLGAVPFAWGNLCVFTSAALYLVDVYGALNGASSLAANGVARYIMGGAFPLFAVQMYSRLGIAWATSLLGFISIAMMPIPWVFFKYGPKIRAKSKYSAT